MNPFSIILLANASNGTAAASVGGTNYVPLVVAVVLVVFIVFMFILNDLGFFDRFKGLGDEKENPDEEEVSTDHNALYINKKTGDKGFIKNFNPGHVDEAGDQDVRFVLDSGKEPDANTGKIEIKPALEYLRTGVYEWHYYPDGLRGEQAKEMEKVKDDLKESRKENMRLKTERNQNHITKLEETLQDEERHGARRASRSKQGYSEDDSGLNGTEDDETKNKDWDRK